MDITEALVGKEVTITATYTGRVRFVGENLVTVRADGSDQLGAMLPRDHITSIREHHQVGDVLTDGIGFIWLKLPNGYVKFNSTAIKESNLIEPVIVISTIADREAARSAIRSDQTVGPFDPPGRF